MTNEEREIRVTLLDGSEVIMNTEERILFRALFTGATPITVDAEHIVDDLILSVEYWEQRAKKWERAYENADRHYLKKEKEAAELRRMIEGREERLGIAIEEYNRLRKALEEAKAEYSKEGTDIQVLRRMIKIIDAALGEGEQDDNSNQA